MSRARRYLAMLLGLMLLGACGGEMETERSKASSTGTEAADETQPDGTLTGDNTVDQSECTCACVAASGAMNELDCAAGENCSDDACAEGEIMSCTCPEPTDPPDCANGQCETDCQADGSCCATSDDCGSGQCQNGACAEGNCCTEGNCCNNTCGQCGCNSGCNCPSTCGCDNTCCGGSCGCQTNCCAGTCGCGCANGCNNSDQSCCTDGSCGGCGCQDDSDCLGGVCYEDGKCSPNCENGYCNPGIDCANDPDCQTDSGNTCPDNDPNCAGVENGCDPSDPDCAQSDVPLDENCPGGNC